MIKSRSFHSHLNDVTLLSQSVLSLINCAASVRLLMVFLRCFLASGHEEREDGQQAERRSSAEPTGWRRSVTEVRVAAVIGVVEIDAGGVFLSTQAALSRNGTAFLIYGHLDDACEQRGHRDADETGKYRKFCKIFH